MTDEQTDLKALVPELVLTLSATQGPEAGVYEVLSINVPVPVCPYNLLWPRELERIKRAGYRVRFVGS
ncbi:hypothetical protein LCGC14_2405220 [marine sediment metagenome]|uniref:Uncharacterized protein n=1 Tax=marine sediment metagenome TaxID=412755 RepID=A0A0F9E6F1_9ZZZZ